MQTALYIGSGILGLVGVVVLLIYLVRKLRYNAQADASFKAFTSGGFEGLARNLAGGSSAEEPGWQGLVTGLALLVLAVGCFLWAHFRV